VRLDQLIKELADIGRRMMGLRQPPRQKNQPNDRPIPPTTPPGQWNVFQRCAGRRRSGLNGHTAALGLYKRI
jgi:hypothetical protein